MLELLKDIDKWLLLYINQSGNPLLDTWMLRFSSKFFWIFLYAILLVFLVRKFGWKGFFYTLPFIVLLVVSTDQVSVKLFKDVFQRFRPCHHEIISSQLRMIVNCGGKYGFVSSHAVNTAGIALFFSLLIRNKLLTPLLVLYALANAYSRVYLGVHYPADVLLGALLGCFIGYIMYSFLLLLNKKHLLLNFDDR